MRVYRIICLKRSVFAKSQEYISDWYNMSNLVYWQSEQAGYTDDIEKAGLYTLDQIDKCAGAWGDWLIEPVWMNLNLEVES